MWNTDRPARKPVVACHNEIHMDLLTQLSFGFGLIHDTATNHDFTRRRES